MLAQFYYFFFFSNLHWSTSLERETLIGGMCSISPTPCPDPAQTSNLSVHWMLNQASHLARAL